VWKKESVTGKCVQRFLASISCNMLSFVAIKPLLRSPARLFTVLTVTREETVTQIPSLPSLQGESKKARLIKIWLDGTICYCVCRCPLWFCKSYKTSNLVQIVLDSCLDFMRSQFHRCRCKMYTRRKCSFYTFTISSVCLSLSWKCFIPT